MKVGRNEKVVLRVPTLNELEYVYPVRNGWVCSHSKEINVTDIAKVVKAVKANTIIVSPVDNLEERFVIDESAYYIVEVEDEGIVYCQSNREYLLSLRSTPISCADMLTVLERELQNKQFDVIYLQEYEKKENKLVIVGDTQDD